MVRGILMYSRFKEEHEWPRAEDARNALEHAIADLEPKIRETGAVVLYDGLPKVRVEPSQLRQVFQNLISNGLKYQQRGCVPRIEVTAEPGVHVHRFTVTDNGIGIHSADFERIFGLFKRLHTMEYSGNGLGLAICRRIIGRYGGRIWVESEVGAGSRFHFTLPAAH
jgi:signal transduction histidine kinase